MGVAACLLKLRSTPYYHFLSTRHIAKRCVGDDEHAIRHTWSTLRPSESGASRGSPPVPITGHRDDADIRSIRWVAIMHVAMQDDMRVACRSLARRFACIWVWSVWRLARACQLSLCISVTDYYSVHNTSSQRSDAAMSGAVPVVFAEGDNDGTSRFRVLFFFSGTLAIYLRGIGLRSEAGVTMLVRIVVVSSSSLLRLLVPPSASLSAAANRPAH